MFRLIILLIIAACISTGCATVNRGTDDHFRIDTVPQGAKITTSIETSKSKRKRRKNKNIAPEYKGCNPTPCAIQLSRLSEFTFTVEHAGYEPAEMYVTSSNKRGSFTANTAATSVTTTSTAVTGAAVSSSLVGTTFSAFSAGSLAPSTGAFVIAAIPPALAFSGGMLLIDAGTGANRNLYPNPVVLELTPEGLPVKYDPAVISFREIESAEYKYNEKCKLRRSYKKADECRALKLDIGEKKKNFKTLLSPTKTSNNSNASPQIEKPK